jgi:hypothetical protein
LLWIVAGVVVLALVAGGIVVLLNRDDGPPAADPAEPTVWEKILASNGPDGTRDVKHSLEAFAYAFGPIPGVQVPSGRPDPPDLRATGFRSMPPVAVLC